MLFAWKCGYIRVHPSIFRVGPAQRSTLSSVLMCVAKLNELRGDPLLLFIFFFFFLGWCHSVMWLTARPTVKDRTSERRIFFLFLPGSFFFLHPEGEKTEERGQKKRSILAPLFSPIWVFFYFLALLECVASFIREKKIPADPSSTLGLGCIYYLGCAVGVQLAVAEKEREEGPRLLCCSLDPLAASRRSVKEKNEKKKKKRSSIFFSLF